MGSWSLKEGCFHSLIAWLIVTKSQSEPLKLVRRFGWINEIWRSSVDLSGQISDKRREERLEASRWKKLVHFGWIANKYENWGAAGKRPILWATIYLVPEALLAANFIYKQELRVGDQEWYAVITWLVIFQEKTPGTHTMRRTKWSRHSRLVVVFYLSWHIFAIKLTLSAYELQIGGPSLVIFTLELFLCDQGRSSRSFSWRLTDINNNWL